MICPPLLSPASAASPYEVWYGHFLEQRAAACALSWDDCDRLSAAERRLVARSMQQFQLGEWARGRGLVRRASSHPALATDSWFLPALKLFIAGEQEHSTILGRFLDRERIPRLTNHWLDAVFRRLRKLAGLELCATVLVTAEVLAIPFYQALRDATRSQLLRAICARILCDEAAHLRFQATTLGLVRRPLGKRARVVRGLGHTILFRGTAWLLWQQHRSVFRAAGWDIRRYWREAGGEFARLEVRILQICSDRGGLDSFDGRRLD
jgi:hypothetical protein